MHDLVIRNARIVDGTGAPEFHGDVAISGQTITHVGEVDGGGRREIDAKGRLLTPGFVDSMYGQLTQLAKWSHSYDKLVAHRRLRCVRISTVQN